MAAVAVTIPASAQPALTPEQRAFIEETRRAALRYAGSLPDFICTEVVHRNDNWGRNSVRKHRADTLTLTVTYFERKEAYKLTLLNGKPASPELMSVGGTVSTGEFGSGLAAVFHPASAAVFVAKETTRLGNRPVDVYKFRVPPEHSSFLVENRGLNLRLNVGYHGEIWIERESHMALRLTEDAEIPKDFPMTASSFQIDYGYVAVAGQTQLLPSHARVVTRGKDFSGENKIEFRDYRKFEAASRITFGADNGNPEPSTEKP
jgi:hypothetical protein